MPDPIIVHCHIFKNGGSTFDWTLSKNFKQNHVKFDKKDNPGHIVSKSELRSLFDNDNDMKAFSSHQIRLPLLPFDYERKILPVIFIRHPIDRLQSAYYFHRIQNDQSSRYIDLAKSSSLKDFAAFTSQGPEFIVFKNHQVRIAGRTDMKPEINSSDFETAKTFLSQCFFVGSVERYDQSMIILEEKLRILYPKIDLAYMKWNYRADRAPSLTQRLEELKVEIGEELYQSIVRQNRYDLELRKFVIDKIDSMVKLDLEFNNKLKNFYRRCKLAEARRPQKTPYYFGKSDIQSTNKIDATKDLINN